MPRAKANGIELEYDVHGDPAAPVILLIMGLGAQMTLWPQALIDELVRRGFRVIRYDNRDIGLSTKFDSAAKPRPMLMMLAGAVGLKIAPPYTVDDMATDAAGLLDALGVKKAHIVGASMGGIIGQVFAARYPERTLSLTSIMSTTGNPRLPRSEPEAARVLFSRPRSKDPEALVAHAIKAARVIGSPAYPPDPAALEAKVRESFARSPDRTGIVRQLAAVIADGDRRERLSAIKAPTVVIHGENDPLVPLAAGRDTAEHIPGARLVVIPGMGHDLPVQLVGTICDAIESVARAR